MNHFLENAGEELARQEKLLVEGKRTLEKAPEGYLKSRSRKKGISFYLGDTAKGKSFEQNITGDLALIEKLLKKKIALETCRRAEKNIEALREFLSGYKENEYTDVLRDIAGCYGSAALVLESGSSANSRAKPVQQNFNPKWHIHETTCGLLVRSKSEVIIANALTGYGIPFIYEKPFPYPDARGFYFEPDFTFELPNGETVIWEHLGLLNDLEYCSRNAYKLNTYQKHGFLIGRNLIITQDDQKGNCSSLYIDRMIRERLLPYYLK